MIELTIADHDGARWAQRQVTQHHYLHAPVDPRSRPLIYLVRLGLHNDPVIGCLMFGRPESTRCYQGALTYGNRVDVAAGRAQFDYWEILNLARVWLDPMVQHGGALYGPAHLPGYTDRRGVWRSTLASDAITLALSRIGYDYLCAYPPVDCAYPYAGRTVLSYCDRRLHRGTIYRAAGFTLARTNERQIETWYTTAVGALSAEQDIDIRHRAELAPRSRRIRAEREVQQMEMCL